MLILLLILLISSNIIVFNNINIINNINDKYWDLAETQQGTEIPSRNELATEKQAMDNKPTCMELP